MIWTLLGLLGLVGLALLAQRLRRQISETDESLRHPKGWVRGGARLEEALLVMDRHLAQARAGANVRLQYGQAGCLTLLRQRPRAGAPGYLARWEFWRPDEALARALLDLPATEVARPRREVLELSFGDDYLSFRQAMSDAFGQKRIEPGNMHLTWNC
ncbi:MAG: hypothetical protein QNJ13_05510 [Paracoccaceae bacterium]|nr:hypothetical protein [Paracoccaceae bacterium]